MGHRARGSRCGRRLLIGQTGVMGSGIREKRSVNSLSPVARCLLPVGLSVLLMGCSTSATSLTEKPSQVEAAVSLVQTLPVSAQIRLRERTIELEVARTPQQQEIGLMNRTTLAEDHGMLFPFEPPQPVRFWMKNTLIPLDMVFLRNGVVKAITASVPPCTTESCTTYGPATAINQVIELRGGRAAELGLKVGDQVRIQFLSTLKSSVH